MGLGGLVTGIMGATGGSPSTHAPDPRRVGRDYQALLQAYINSSPALFENESTYQPLYTRLGLENVQMAREAGVAGAGAVAPEIMDITRGYNPRVTGLLDELGSQASEQLSQNGALDPAMERRLVQNVRGSQAARGLGYGPGDAAMEDYYLTNTMEQRRMANQAFAQNTAAAQTAYYKDPFSVAAGVTTPVSAAPTIIPSNQSDAMMGTAYNARASANLANLNAQTAMLQGFNSFD